MNHIIKLISVLLLDVLCMIMPIIAYTHTNVVARVILFIVAGSLIELRANYELWTHKKERNI